MTTIEPEITEMTEFGALVKTADGSYTIRHEGHGQEFHSTEGAKFEAWELYVVASGFLGALDHSRGFIRILDVGMGLSYNACATIAAWLQSAGENSVEMTSLEIDPRLAQIMVGAQAPWCRGWEPTWLAGPKALTRHGENLWNAELSHPKTGKTLTWRIVVGDASEAAAETFGHNFDYVWQDPFTPELNPGMWSAEWFAKLSAVSAPDVNLMTYSVSRVVKDALEAGGWVHERFRTPGRKRHWLRASKRPV